MFCMIFFHSFEVISFMFFHFPCNCLFYFSICNSLTHKNLHFHYGSTLKWNIYKVLKRLNINLFIKRKLLNIIFYFDPMNFCNYCDWLNQSITPTISWRCKNHGSAFSLLWIVIKFWNNWTSTFFIKRKLQNNIFYFDSLNCSNYCDWPNQSWLTITSRRGH